jgi:hypothetical protein
VSSNALSDREALAVLFEAFDAEQLRANWLLGAPSKCRGRTLPIAGESQIHYAQAKVSVSAVCSGADEMQEDIETFR